MSRLTWPNRPLYENAARIVVTHDSCSTILRVITRHSNGKHNFYLNRYRFIEWLDKNTSPYLEMDGIYLLRATEYDGIVSLHFTGCARDTEVSCRVLLRTLRSL